MRPHQLKVLSVAVGVGDASASTTAALLLSIVQESMGRIATIVFAHKLGSSLEPECKMYRLAADVFNDTSMILDCLSPALPKLPRVLLLGCSSILRALCGVAAGSSKASLSAHFARWGNLGELNAVSPHFCNEIFSTGHIKHSSMAIQGMVDLGPERHLLPMLRISYLLMAERFESRDSHLSARNVGGCGFISTIIACSLTYRRLAAL